jgi:hypothetical protein
MDRWEIAVNDKILPPRSVVLSRRESFLQFVKY